MQRCQQPSPGRLTHLYFLTSDQCSLPPYAPFASIAIMHGMFDSIDNTAIFEQCKTGVPSSRRRTTASKTPPIQREPPHPLRIRPPPALRTHRRTLVSSAMAARYLRGAAGCRWRGGLGQEDPTGCLFEEREEEPCGVAAHRAFRVDDAHLLAHPLPDDGDSAGRSWLT